MKKIFKKVKNAVKKFWQKFIVKVQDGCIWIVKMIKKAIEWCMDNQEVVYVAIGAVSIGSSIYKKYFYKTAAQEGMEYQRKHIYDYSIGHHWTLKRELTSDEMKEYERRKAEGECTGDILESMRVLA